MSYWNVCQQQQQHITPAPSYRHLAHAVAVSGTADTTGTPRTWHTSYACHWYAEWHTSSGTRSGPVHVPLARRVPRTRYQRSGTRDWHIVCHAPLAAVSMCHPETWRTDRRLIRDTGRAAATPGTCTRAPTTPMVVTRGLPRRAWCRASMRPHYSTQGPVPQSTFITICNRLSHSGDRSELSDATVRHGRLAGRLTGHSSRVRPRWRAWARAHVRRAYLCPHARPHPRAREAFA